MSNLTIRQVKTELDALVEQMGKNMATIDHYITLKRQENTDMKKLITLITRYAKESGDWELSVEIGLHGFCACMMHRLSGVTKKMYGEEIWGKIFGGVEMPTDGWTDWTLTERKDFALFMQQRFLSAISLEDYKRALEGVSRTWNSDNEYRDEYSGTTPKKVTLKKLDAYIQKQNDNYIKHLHNQYPSKNPEVMEEFNSDKWKIRREGHKIIFAMYPFLMDKYATHTDEKMKRYYACRCPWVRASILKGEAVSVSFCHCNLGYQKSGYDYFFGRNLNARVVQSVLEDGVLQCIFEIDIPEDILE